MRNDILNKKDLILSLIEKNEPKCYISNILQCKQETLNAYLKKMNIDYAGNMGMKGKKISKGRISAIDYANKKVVSVSKLRRKLIRDGIKEAKCEKCGLSEWLNNPIPLELHHIDYNRYNNNLSNLQILCPNCHALIPNHSKKIPL